jgi:hypothetical protein
MPKPTPTELKKLLASAGFEIYRTTGDRVELADRVRDNLIMDSGVSVLAADEDLVVRFITRAQASEFAGESEQQLFERARRMGAAAVGSGYAEVSTRAVPVLDPGDRARVLDTWYEVAFERGVAEENLTEQIGYVMGLPKSAIR